jgi:UDP-N-acetyl-D-mannosaminuronate dehydrogenase
MNLYENLLRREEKIAVIGLGYVGMPIAVAFAKKVDVVGFDLNEKKIHIRTRIRYCTVKVKSKYQSLNDIRLTAGSNCTSFFVSDYKWKTLRRRMGRRGN